jgi:magnesium transporter
MNTELIKPEIRALIEARNWGALRTTVTEYRPAEAADLLLELETADRALFFRALPPDYATEVFAHLRPEQQDDLLRDLTDDETRRLLADLAPDDRTQLLSELPGTVTQRLMTLLSPDDLREARDLLGYPEESVGRLMTPDYVAVRPTGRPSEPSSTSGPWARSRRPPPWCTSPTRSGGSRGSSPSDGSLAPNPRSASRTSCTAP